MKTNQISIYFHWPFCESKCPYCDFNSYVRNKINHKEWLSAYLNNIDFWKEKLDQLYYQIHILWWRHSKFNEPTLFIANSGKNI